ncbi:MAG TPA: hypothetical protein DDW52_08265, partial [Planctomycetaceae bacterium]|nr:hypothetical protein [Planctomycetaceae bacterium]
MIANQNTTRQATELPGAREVSAMIVVALLVAWLLATITFSGPIFTAWVGGFLAFVAFCALRLGPVPLLFVITLYLAIVEEPDTLVEAPLAACFQIGLALLLVGLISRIRTIEGLNGRKRTKFREFIGGLREGINWDQVANSVSSIVVVVCSVVVASAALLWLTPLDGTSLREVGLRPGALRAIRIALELGAVFLVLSVVV